MSNLLKGIVIDPKVIRGKSAYEIAVMEGFVGTQAEWIESLKGAPGKDGEKGDPSESVTDEHINELIDAKLAELPTVGPAIEVYNGEGEVV